VLEHISACCDWGGYGIRKQLPSWETGFIPKSGSGIRLTMTDKKGKEKAFTFICNEPDKVVALLAA
jgi:hypothetical protein